METNNLEDSFQPFLVKTYLFIYFWLVIIFGFTAESMISPVDQPSAYPSFVSFGNKTAYFLASLLLVLGFLKRRSLLNWLITGPLFLVIVYGYLFVNQQVAVVAFIFLVWSSQTVSFRSLVRIDLFARIIVTISLFVVNNLQLLPVSPIIQLGVYSRFSFGFHHPNALGMYLMMISLEMFYLYARKSVKPIVLLILSGILIFVLTRSRGSLISVMSFVVLVTVFNTFKSISFRKLLYSFCILVPLICFLGSLTISIFLPSSSKVFQTLNDWMSGRPELLKLVYDYYAQKSFFGGDIAELANAFYSWSINVRYLYVDNQYMYSVMIFGWFGAVLEVLYSTYCGIRAKIFGDSYLLFWLTAIALFGLVETKLVTLDMALPFMCLGSLTEGVTKDKKVLSAEQGHLQAKAN